MDNYCVLRLLNHHEKGLFLMTAGRTRNVAEKLQQVWEFFRRINSKASHNSITSTTWTLRASSRCSSPLTSACANDCHGLFANKNNDNDNLWAQTNEGPNLPCRAVVGASDYQPSWAKKCCRRPERHRDLRRGTSGTVSALAFFWKKTGAGEADRDSWAVFLWQKWKLVRSFPIFPGDTWWQQDLYQTRFSKPKLGFLLSTGDNQMRSSNVSALGESIM